MCKGLYLEYMFLQWSEFMEKYEELKIKITFFFNSDVITNSTSESADDLGEWNSDWFVPSKEA